MKSAFQNRSAVRWFCISLLFCILVPLLPVRAEERVQFHWDKEVLEEGPLSASVSDVTEGDLLILATYCGDRLESAVTAPIQNGAAEIQTEVSELADAAKLFLWESSTLSAAAPVLDVLTPGVVYHGFAGRYQHIYANGKKVQEKDGKIVVNESALSDLSDQFLPRDMGDGSYAFEARSSNQPERKSSGGSVQEIYSGSTRRIATAELGQTLPSAEYVFSNLTMASNPTFAGMNDDTQHWIRERSDSYTALQPSYYLRSLDNDLYAGLSPDGTSLIATEQANRATITFEALNEESPLYQLSKTEEYALLSDEQRAKIERVYESVAGDAFERHGAIVAENESPRGRLDMIYRDWKTLTKDERRQKLLSYVSMSGGYVADHPTTSYHVSWNLPGTEGVTAVRGELKGEVRRTDTADGSAKTFLSYPLNIYAADGTLEQTIDLQFQKDSSVASYNAGNFEQIVTKIPYIYRKDINLLTVEQTEDPTNTYNSNGPHIFIRLSHGNTAASVLDYMMHEMGHSLDSRRGGGNYWSYSSGLWDQARRADLFSMSRYGAAENTTYVVEDFAEFCRYYFLCYGNRDRQRALQILCPNRYKLFRQVCMENLNGLTLWEDGIVLPEL